MKHTQQTPDQKNNLTMNEQVQISHSRHSNKRASQRGIQNPWINTVVREGRVVHKQGYRFFYMTDKELKFQNPSKQDKLKNLVVVMAGDSNTVVTCYKNKSAIGNIKRKSKKLL